MDILYIFSLLNQVFASINNKAFCPQLTAVTAYMDMSLVYGNNEMQHRPLRANVGGRLLVEARGGKEYPPTETNSSVVCESAHSSNEACYLTGLHYSLSFIVTLDGLDQIMKYMQSVEKPKLF